MKDIEEVKRGRPVDPVRALASQALDAVMTPGREHDDVTGAPVSYETWIALLSEAFRDDDPARRRLVVGDILASGVDPHELIGSHIVDTAELLGKMWARNQISFAEVTIGAARLQETVRSLSARRRSAWRDVSGPEILLVAPGAENHLLALFVVGEAFEELGCYVHIAIGQEPDAIVRLAQERHFDMIGFSIASTRALKSVGSIVKRLRKSSARSTPLVLGGGICRETAKHTELLEETGVDHITSCPNEALKLCGLKALRVRAPEPRQARAPEGSDE
ncbi:methylmalonyl-CoA mutase cobalamin-binding domain/chain [Litoreibacter ponti]|uniref:Methylmalonyl-CoA mutase cobalamin-binding domain/chain n=1 Tax=Litoreibacter ponti TaxID=1510457 RepID=A0A2T6BPL6_9RHOB|nr:cobalamin B12-binding domain-containing protein [Litoreibacter ponti]PTX57974.1 methylmalonyl-CoA mutase cobalamin-binding domain/chain [Litoreibacter ponti]